MLTSRVLNFSNMPECLFCFSHQTIKSHLSLSIELTIIIRQLIFLIVSKYGLNESFNFIIFI